MSSVLPFLPVPSAVDAARTPVFRGTPVSRLETGWVDGV